MEWWQAALLGLVEGITEYLPISSTGHLILASSLLGLDRPEQRNALAAFQVAIQGGAILAVLGLYASRVAQMARGVVGRDPAGLRLLVNVAIVVPHVAPTSSQIWTSGASAGSASPLKAGFGTIGGSQ